MSPAERKADQKAAKKALNAKNNAKNNSKRAKKRAREKASIVDNHPTFNTPAFAVPGKDFNVLRHEDDVVLRAVTGVNGNISPYWHTYMLRVEFRMRGRMKVRFKSLCSCMS